MMKISAVLFDFDGLLVNTEPLHYLAYMRMCQDHGLALDWDFAKFCHEAHSQEGGFFAGLRKEIPTAFDRGLTASVLYAAKTQWYNRLLETEPVVLMPGVEQVLIELASRGVKRAVVTNSPKSQIERVQQRLPLLTTIPLWITREDYRLAKPSPEGYLLALERLQTQGPAIGFEDTLKGVQALQGAAVAAVLVSSIDYSGVALCKDRGAQHWEELSWDRLKPILESRSLSSHG